MENQKLSEIFNRKCCRNFDNSKEIPVEKLKLIMEAGQAAPSAKNRQPYHFILITNQECRNDIVSAADEGRKKQFSNLSPEEFERTMKGGTGSNDRTIADASAAILVMRDSNPEYKESDKQSKNLNIKEEQGVATATYSMMLQAEKLGISSCWICSMLYIREELKEILERYGVKFKDTWEPRVIIPLGYPTIEGKKPIREPLEDKSTIIE